MKVGKGQVTVEGTAALSGGAPDRPTNRPETAGPLDDAETRHWLAAIVDSSDDATIGKDLDGIITSWNPGAQRLYGYTPEEVVGRPISLLIPAERPDELPEIMRRLRQGQHIEQYETTRIRKDGVHLTVSVSISPIRSTGGQIIGAASIARDTTRRRQDEQRYLDLLASERAARERAERAADRTSRLQGVTEALARALTIEDAARAVIEHGLPGLGAVAGAVGLLTDDGEYLDMVATVGYPPSLVNELQQQPLSNRTPLTIAVRDGQAIWREATSPIDTRFDERVWRARVYPSGVAIPLVVDGRIIGGIGISFKEPRAFDEDDRQFIQALVGQCAQAIQRIRLYETEQAAREQLDAILGGIADGVTVQREDGTCIYANESAVRMCGFESADVFLSAGAPEVARRLAFLDADGQPLSFEKLPARRALQEDSSPEMVLQYRRFDTGEVRWARTQSRTVRGTGGQRLAISIFHDMTDEERARERLRFLAEAGAQLAGSLNVEETLAGLVQVASNTLADWAAVILIDEEGAVQHIATAHRDPEREREARTLHERQLRHAAGATLLWQVVQSGEPLLVPIVTDEMLAQTARDATHLALLRALGLSSLLYAPLIAGGRVLGVLALFMSGSSRRFTEADRAIAVEMARRASLTLENARLYREANDAVQARDEFLSIASHELRTPVTSISGVAQVALRAKERGRLDDARLMRALQQIMRGSQRLVALTEDLLDVSRLQTGRFELRLEALDLAAFVVDLTERFGATLDEQHQLLLEVDGDPRTVPADSARLEQVLANLLSNAVKYSPDGGPIVVAMRHVDSGVQITVRDEGIGLPDGTEESIFQPFGRAANATHRQIQGLGLGLYISRQIVERHGGRIWAESSGDERGVTMHVWLPRE